MKRGRRTTKGADQRVSKGKLRGPELLDWLDTAIQESDAKPGLEVETPWSSLWKMQKCSVCGAEYFESLTCGYTSRRKMFKYIFTPEVMSDYDLTVARLEAHEKELAMEDPANYFYRRYLEQKRPKFPRGGRSRKGRKSK